MEDENEYNELIESGKYLRSSRNFVSANHRTIKHTSNHRVRQRNLANASHKVVSQSHKTSYELDKSTSQYISDSGFEHEINEKQLLINGTPTHDKIAVGVRGEHMLEKDKDHYQSANDTLWGNSSSSRSSAYEIYKAAGEWWNVFPKTDYTYAKSSACRREIAPGVLPMPNMSRRPLHAHGAEAAGLYHADSTAAEDRDTIYSLSRTRISETRNFVITSIFISIWTFISHVFNTVTLRKHHLGSKTTPVRSRGSMHKPWYHKFEVLYYKSACLFLLMDVWILSLFQKSQDYRHKDVNASKHSKYLILLLLPLLLLAGFWWASSLSTSESAMPSLSLDDPQAFFKVKDASVQGGGHMHDDNGNIEIIVEKILTSPEFKNILLLQDERRKQETVKHEEMILSTIQQEQDRLRSELEHKSELLLKQQEVYSQLLLENSNMKKQLEELGVEVKGKVAYVLPHFRRLESQFRVLQADRIHLTQKLKECCKAIPPVFTRVDIEDHVTSFLSGLFGLQARGEARTTENLKLWIKKLFEAKEDLEERLANITTNMNVKIDEVSEKSAATIMSSVLDQMKIEFMKHEAQHNVKQESFLSSHIDEETHLCGNCTLSVEQVKEIVNNALNLYDADKTGMVDYALESGGGMVINTRCTENYDAKSPALSFLGFFFPWSYNHPRIAIQPEVQPGKCWAFRGAWGYLVIKLTTRIKISAFSMDHIPRSLSPAGNIDSAPKNFSVWGMENETDRDPVLLGKYMYNDYGPSLQVFPVQNKEASPYQIVELRIESNHGNLDYTCLYRFRVHGIPS